MALLFFLNITEYLIRQNKRLHLLWIDSLVRHFFYYYIELQGEMLNETICY